MVNVQREITLRAIELLLLPGARANMTNTDDDQPTATQQPISFILDVGCGSGLSGQVLEEHGHIWVGCDVSRDMLQVAKEKMNSRTKGNDSANMEEDDEDSNNSNNDDDNEEEDEDSDEDLPSTGDLMHHVRSVLWLMCLFVGSSSCGAIRTLPGVRTPSLRSFSLEDEIEA